MSSYHMFLSHTGQNIIMKKGFGRAYGFFLLESGCNSCTLSPSTWQARHCCQRASIFLMKMRRCLCAILLILWEESGCAWGVWVSFGLHRSDPTVRTQMRSFLISTTGRDIYTAAPVHQESQLEGLKSTFATVDISSPC